MRTSVVLGYPRGVAASAATTESLMLSLTGAGLGLLGASGGVNMLGVALTTAVVMDATLLQRGRNRQ